MKPAATKRDLLDRINSLVVDGQPLRERQIGGGYNVWQFYQTSILFRDLPALGRAKPPVAPSARWQHFLFTLFILVESSWALLYAFLTQRRILVFTNDKVN